MRIAKGNNGTLDASIMTLMESSGSVPAPAMAYPERAMLMTMGKFMR